jgi:hypothetical protein
MQTRCSGWPAKHGGVCFAFVSKDVILVDDD